MSSEDLDQDGMARSSWHHGLCCLKGVVLAADDCKAPDPDAIKIILEDTIDRKAACLVHVDGFKCIGQPVARLPCITRTLSQSWPLLAVRD